MLKNEILNIIIVGTGGFVGSALRYITAKVFQHINLVFLPYSTFTVNIAGSLILGFISFLILESSFLSPRFGLFLTVGFCGGFTTFSTFSYENMTLIRDGLYFHSLIYSLLSILVSLAFVFLGYYLAKIIMR